MIAVEDGEVAVSILEVGGIDLIITDTLMPRGSGIDVLRAARRCDSRIPVIVMTGHPSIEDAAELATLDVTDYISKPFDLERSWSWWGRIWRSSRETANAATRNLPGARRSGDIVSRSCLVDDR